MSSLFSVFQIFSPEHAQGLKKESTPNVESGGWAGLLPLAGHGALRTCPRHEEHSPRRQAASRAETSWRRCLQGPGDSSRLAAEAGLPFIEGAVSLVIFKIIVIFKIKNFFSLFFSYSNFTSNFYL